MTEILSHERKTRTFVGRAVKDMTSAELAQVNPSKVNHIDVGFDLYLGFTAFQPYPGESELKALRRTKEHFFNMTNGVEPKVLTIHTVVSVVQSE